jgi:hypothetical protein
MAYDDPWEHELFDRLHRWQRARWSRELLERHLDTDERLDEVGWEIFSYATRAMDEERAARLAMEGNYRTRLRVRDDMHGRDLRELLHRFRELQPSAVRYTPFDTRAPEQLEFWRENLPDANYVYFIQSSDSGPVKIGLSRDPFKRVGALQTGNPQELFLRHVIPGDLNVERELHHRFRAARIRREWFGREYLPIILAFSAGLADEMVHAYDGAGVAPALCRGEVRTVSEIERMRRDIERLWFNYHSIPDIAKYLLLDVEEVASQLVAMTRSSLHQVNLDYWEDPDGRIWIPTLSEPIVC